MRLAMLGLALLADPIVTTPARRLDCLPPNGLKTQGVCTVAMSQHTLLVSRGDDAGNTPGCRVRVYSLRDGVWQADGTLPVAGRPSVRMGYAADASETHVIVGGMGDEEHKGFGGQVTIYRRESGTWTVEKIIERERVPSYGWAVAIAGDRAFVATLAGDRAGVDIFSRGDGGWTIESRIERPQDAPEFGIVIDATDRTLCVSARSSNRVYVYERADEKWSLAATLTDPESKETDWFGNSVAIVDDRIVVGAPQFNDDLGCGRVIVYARERDKAGWRLESRLTAPDASERDWFGAAVAVSEQYIAVGAYGDDGPNGPTGRGSGAVYLFELKDARWTCAERVVATEVGQTTSFGNCLALSGRWLAVTSPDTPRLERGEPEVHIDPGCLFIHRIGGKVRDDEQ